MCLRLRYVSPFRPQAVVPECWFPVLDLFPQCNVLLVRVSPGGLPPSFCGCHVSRYHCVTGLYKANYTRYSSRLLYTYDATYDDTVLHVCGRRLSTQ